MSKKITLKNLRGGRLGDRLKTISSMLIWSKILNAELVWSPCCNNLKSAVNFFSDEAIEANKILLSFPGEKVYTKEICNFKGATLDEVMEVKKEFDENDFDLFVFSGVPRIHFHHLFGFAEFCSEFRDIYYASIKWFNDLYWYDRIKKSNENISISMHIRRGDLTEQQISSGLDCDYYKKLITMINNQAKLVGKPVKITIFSENEWSQSESKLRWFHNVDIFPLYELENVEPRRDGTVEEDFHGLCSSDILIAGRSGFSTMASYLCSGATLYKSSGFISPPGVDHFFTNKDTVPTDVCLFSNYDEFKRHLELIFANEHKQ